MKILPHMTHTQDDIDLIEWDNDLHLTGWLEISTNVVGKAMLVPVFTRGNKPAPFTIEAMDNDDNSGIYDNISYKDIKHTTTPRKRNRQSQKSNAPAGQKVRKRRARS